MADLWLIALLVLVAVTCALWGLFSLRRDSRRRVRQLIEQPLAAVDTGAGAGEAHRRGPLWLLGQALRPILPARILEELRWRLLWAGRPGNLTAEEFMALRLSGALVLGALAPLALMRLPQRTGPGLAVLLAICLAGFGLLAPDVWLAGLVSRRRQMVQRELPLFLDLVAATVEAGLPLGESVRRVAEEMPGLLTAEFMRAYQEMAAGKPRTAAWRDLADRTPSQELKQVAMAILQAEQYGTSVADQLRLQVRQLREYRQRRAQEVAQAASVKMRVPLPNLV